MYLTDAELSQKVTNVQYWIYNNRKLEKNMTSSLKLPHSLLIFVWQLVMLSVFLTR